MPIYEFKCMTCQKISEIWVKSSEMNKRITECPECGQDAKKIMSVTQFKMNGGYTAANGYAGDSK